MYWDSIMFQNITEPCLLVTTNESIERHLKKRKPDRWKAYFPLWVWASDSNSRRALDQNTSILAGAVNNS
jgi:hypothetical protein